MLLSIYYNLYIYVLTVLHISRDTDVHLFNPIVQAHQLRGALLPLPQEEEAEDRGEHHGGSEVPGSSVTGKEARRREARNGEEEEDENPQRFLRLRYKMVSNYRPVIMVTLPTVSVCHKWHA